MFCVRLSDCIPTGFPVGSHVAAITHGGSNNLLFPHASNALKFYLT